MDTWLIVISLRTKPPQHDKSLTPLQNNTLLSKPKRKNRSSKSQAPKVKAKLSLFTLNNLSGIIRPVTELTKTKRSKKLYSSANCAKPQERNPKWNHAPTANTISTWHASSWTTTFQNGTFATSAVLREKKKCGNRKGGCNKNKNWWPRSCRNWCPRRLKKKKRKRSTQKDTASSVHVIRIIYRTSRNLNIRYKINSSLYIDKFSTKIMRRQNPNPNPTRLFPPTRLLTSCRFKTSFPPSKTSSRACLTTSPKTSGKTFSTFQWYPFFYLELRSYWLNLLQHGFLSA